MDTSKMLHLYNLKSNDLFSLFEQSKVLKDISLNFNKIMDISLLRVQIMELINTHYNLGEVIEVYEVFGGYINRSFAIYAKKDGIITEYFIRKYKDGVTDNEILFEHSLIKFAIENGLNIAADVISAKNGQSYVKLSSQSETTSRVQYFAVYEYLAGEDKYTWDNPTCNDEEYKSAAQVLATFHNAARKFNPKDLSRVEPKIMEFLPTLTEKFKEFANRVLNTKFHKYYLKNLDEILQVIKTSQIDEKDTERMIYNPCHNDYHPGNLKFTDNKAVGIFDFDWSKVDLRLFDVCLAMAYCCSSWDDLEDGTLRIDKCKIFLDSYQEKLKDVGELPPLDSMEKKHLPTMMAAANMYLINWDVSAYYTGSELNEYEYTAYLQHNIRLMNYIEKHKKEITDLANSI